MGYFLESAIGSEKYCNYNKDIYLVGINFKDKNISKFEWEKMNIIDVDSWFELKDLRNEIAYEYGDDMQNNLQIINEIFQSLDKIETILKKIEKVVEEKK